MGKSSFLDLGEVTAPEAICYLNGAFMAFSKTAFHIYKLEGRAGLEQLKEGTLREIDDKMGEEGNAMGIPGAAKAEARAFAAKIFDMVLEASE